MSSPMEYGAPEDAASEYGGADGGAPEHGGVTEYDGARALPPCSENVPGDIGYGREWHDEPLAQVAADAFGHVVQDAEQAAGNVLGEIPARSDFS